MTEHHPSPPPSPPGPSGWLEPLILNALLDIKSRQGEEMAELRALKHEIFPRFERIEARLEAEIEKLERRSPPPASATSSWVHALFGSVGSAIVEHLPWKHAILLSLAFVLGTAGHIMPEQIASLLTGLKAWLVK